jgi:hypothetical protein
VRGPETGKRFSETDGNPKRMSHLAADALDGIGRPVIRLRVGHGGGLTTVAAPTRIHGPCSTPLPVLFHHSMSAPWSASDGRFPQTTESFRLTRTGGSGNLAALSAKAVL